MTRTAVIAGLGACVPPRLVTNEALAAELTTSDEWIRTRTGIGQRYVVDPGTSTGHLATEAGRLALASAERSTVDVVVLATSTPDRPVPATAPVVATRLGLTGAGAFDVVAVCTGFVYALATAGGLIGTGVADSALVIGADTFSVLLDPADRTTRVVFGDGAGAVVLRAGEVGEPGALLGFDLGSDGTGADLIAVDGYLRMAGPRVFAQAVRRMTSSVRDVLAMVGWAVEDVDLLVPHQANARILAECATSLGLPAGRVVSNVDRVGNTVAGSIPLALADAGLTVGQRIVLTGFGGGLTWGSVAVRWPEIVVRRVG